MATLKNDKEISVEDRTLEHTDSTDNLLVEELDEAGLFLKQYKDVDTLHIDVRKVRRKVDFHIIPIMFVIWVCAFLDKMSYNYSAVMGIKKDLHFVGNDFSNIASASSLSLLLMQIPNIYLVQRLPASKYLSLSCFAWSIATLCTAAVQNVAGLMALRVILSMFEAVIGPSLMLITAQWYLKSEQAPRFAIWHTAPGWGLIIGGLLSFAFQDIHKSALSSWRWMFICLGLMSFVTACIAIVFLPDTPMKARFLTLEEKVALLRHVSVNMTGVANKKFHPRQLGEAALDFQVWFLVLPALCAAMSHGLSTYSTTIIKDMGYTAKQTALLNMPSGVAAILFTLAVGFGIRKLPSRWLWAIITTIPGIIGSAIISFAHLTKSNQGLALLGIYLIPAVNSITVILSQWSMANVAGNTKRALVAGMMTASVSLAGIISPQTFQAKDEKTGYIPAKVTILVTQAAAAVFIIILWRYYVWENKRRDKKARALGIDQVTEEHHAEHISSRDAWSGLTDKQNIKFRYVY